MSKARRALQGHLPGIVSTVFGGSAKTASPPRTYSHEWIVMPLYAGCQAQHGQWSNDIIARIAQHSEPVHVQLFYVSSSGLQPDTCCTESCSDQQLKRPAVAGAQDNNSQVLPVSYTRADGGEVEMSLVPALH